MSNITTSSTGANSSKLPQVPNYGDYYNNAATYPHAQTPQASSQASLINQTPSSAFQHQSITHTNVQQLPDPTPSISTQRAQSPIVKQVPSCEFFPMESVKTNVIGTDNVLSAAENYFVKKYKIKKKKGKEVH